MECAIRPDSYCPMLRNHNDEEGCDENCVTRNQFILQNIKDACAKHIGANWKELAVEPCVLL